MSQEIAIKSYYQSTRDSNIIDTNLVCRFGMEFFLSNLLFKGDLSRVVYSKEDIAFRRRVETVGKGDVENNNYNYINLDLPYAVYSQTGSYEEDDRGSTQNVGQIVLGQVQPESGIVLKAAALKIKYSATAFFARRDDINIASQLLYWEKTPKFPVYYIVQHELYGWPIDIPVFITLDSFDSNVEYAEKDWLEKSKIFPIKMEFTIRSYQTLIESIDRTIKLPIRFSGLYGYNEDAEEPVYTETTSLIWADTKWSPNALQEVTAKIPEVDSMGNIIHQPQDFDKYYIDPPSGEGIISNGVSSEVTFENNGRFIHEVVNETIADAIKGYFNEIRDCVLDEYHQVDDKTTENSIFIEWKINENQKDNFHSIVIYIPGLVRDEITNDLSNFEITGLYPGSEYDCTLIVTSKSFSKTTYKLLLKTKGESLLEQPLKDNLVGKTFQQTTFTGKSGKFTGADIRKSLIGKEIN